MPDPFGNRGRAEWQQAARTPNASRNTATAESSLRQRIGETDKLLEGDFFGADLG